MQNSKLNSKKPRRITKLYQEVKFPKYEIHSGASYHSKLLPTKEITKLLDKIKIDSFLVDNELKELSPRICSS